MLESLLNKTFALKFKITEFFQKKEVVVKTLTKGFVFRLIDQKLKIFLY